MSENDELDRLQEDDFEVLQGNESARRLVEYHAREWGWEPIRARRGGASIHCDSNVKQFFECANELLQLLASNRLFADTDAGIEDLTRMRQHAWWKYVDPALSRQKSGPNAGSVVVLWHCWDHVISLHNKGNGEWAVYQGEDELLELQKLIDEGWLDEDDEVEDEILTLRENVVENLTPEDLERRKLLPKKERIRIEEESDDF